MGAQGGDDAHAVLHHVPAPLPVGGDAGDAVVHKGMYRVGQGLHALDQVVEDDGLEGVELQLARLGGHGDGDVVSDDVEGHLADHLGDDGVDLPRHDGGAVLPGRQVDLAEAAAGAGGHEPQVVGHLGQVDGAGLNRAGHGHEPVQVLGGVDEVGGLHQLKPGDLGQVGDDAAQIPLVGVDAGADGGAPHVEAAHLVLGPLEAGDVPAHRPAVGPELLPQTDGHRVLHLRAAHLEHVVKLLRLGLQGLREPLELDLGPHQQLEHRQLARRGEHIVGGLAVVDVVVGVDQGVVPLLPAQQLDGPVGDDLVGVHVQAGARAALDGVHDERLVEPARRNLIAGPHDGVGHPLVQQADLQVGDGGGLLDLRDGVDLLRMYGQPGDGKVLRRPQGLDAVVDVLGDRPLPHGVVLGAVLDAHGTGASSQAVLHFIGTS